MPQETINKPQMTEEDKKELLFALFVGGSAVWESWILRLGKDGNEEGYQKRKEQMLLAVEILKKY